VTDGQANAVPDVPRSRRQRFPRAGFDVGANLFGLCCVELYAKIIGSRDRQNGDVKAEARANLRGRRVIGLVV
jgi:hypothetical protein